MLIHDAIYGDFDITEPVLLELLEDPTVKRAATVMQSATTAPINGFEDFSRLEHCIGVMLLIRSLGGLLAEQIAGLLHDISHTAFSHVVDVVYKKSLSQNYHEEIKEDLILKSGIPRILEKYGFKTEEILDDSKYGLLERSSPQLCADRLDYTFRNLLYFKDNLKKAILYFKHLSVFDGQIVFDNVDVAREFAEDYLELDQSLWSDPRCQTAYFILADALRKALDERILVESDLMRSDSELWSVLVAQRGSISELMNKLTPGLQVQLVDENPEYLIHTKTRFVNPPVYIKESSELVRVFDIFPEVALRVTDHQVRFSKPFGVKVITS